MVTAGLQRGPCILTLLPSTVKEKHIQQETGGWHPQIVLRSPAGRPALPFTSAHRSSARGIQMRSFQLAALFRDDISLGSDRLSSEAFAKCHYVVRKEEVIKMVLREVDGKADPLAFGFCSSESAGSIGKRKSRYLCSW